MSPTLREAGDAGSTVHNCPESILPFMEFPLCSQKPIPFCHLSFQQPEQFSINQRAVFEEVLSQIAFLLKTTFFQNTGRGRIVRMDMGQDFDQTKLLESELAEPPDHSGHDAPAPERLTQPIAHFGPVRFAQLEITESTRSNQGIVGAANGEMHRTPLLL